MTFGDSNMVRPWEEDGLCAVCPGQVHDPGQFDIAAGPGPASRYDTARGYRCDLVTGVPVCVHPDKIGFPPGRYASAGEPWPVDAAVGPAPGPLPDRVEGLAGWMAALVRHADPEQVDRVLAEAERAAASRFPPGVVVDALREALAGG